MPSVTRCASRAFGGADGRSQELVGIVDFGSQFTQLIARAVREASVYCEIFPPGEVAEELRRRPFRGIILSGGPRSVYEEGAPTIDTAVLTRGIPILGICYGMQLVCHKLGGAVSPSRTREYGRTSIRLEATDGLFEGIPRRSRVWMSHGDVVRTPGKDWIPLAHSENGLLCAVKHARLPIYAVQFHPEVSHTEYGIGILQNFLFRICGCQGTWRMSSFVEDQVRAIREKVGHDRILCGLSGGVDSTVVATLVHRAIGHREICVFVDNGLLRKNEAEDLARLFKSLDLNVTLVDARERFLRALRGVKDPERKRKIIGHVFADVFEAFARKQKGIRWLAQGTLYPDWIESTAPFGGPTATIKTHHNVGGLPKRLKLGLIEPLKYLFKDEVRKVAQELGLPRAFWSRQPFPGPGLAVRILGEITRRRLEIVRAADSIIREEIERTGRSQRLWQYFAVLLPIRSVGVMGDARTYEHVIAIRAVESRDGMTADWARLPPELLGRISNRITNEVKGANRVVYDVSSKPPSTIEWE